MKLADKGTPANLAFHINPEASEQDRDYLEDLLENAIDEGEIRSFEEEYPYRDLSKPTPYSDSTPTKVYRRREAKLRDAAKWAHKHGFQVSPKLAKQLSLQSPSSVEIENAEGKNPKRQPEPRDSTLKEVLAATALAFGYDPTSGKKAAQGKLKAIVSKCCLDDDTVKNAIENAIRSTGEKSDTQS